MVGILVVVNLERLKLGLGTIKTGHLKEVVNLERWSTYRGCDLYKYISGQSWTVKNGQVREVVRLRRWSTLEVFLYLFYHSAHRVCSLRFGVRISKQNIIIILNIVILGYRACKAKKGHFLRKCPYRMVHFVCQNLPTIG